MPGGTTIAGLVDGFVETLFQHGIVIDRPAVEQEVRERIGEIAVRLGVDPETVVRDHATEDWGQEMAAGVVNQIQNECLLDIAGSPLH